MTDKPTEEQAREPRGFSEHTRGLAGEYAHEQGWGLNEEERTREPETKQAFEGGTDYDYGARDFGDTAVDTSSAQPSPEAEAFLTENAKED
jgi:hypothetical protein